MDIQEILATLAQSSNSAAMAAQQLASTLAGANQSAGGASASIKNLNKGVSLVTSKLNPLAATVNAVAQSLMGYMGAQIRLTKTVLDFQSQVYDTEDTLANMTTGVSDAFKTMQDMVSSTTGPFLAILKEVPGIGELIGAGEKMVVEGLKVVESANAQNMKVVSSSFKAMQNLNSNFGVLTTSVKDFSVTATNAGMTSDQFSRMLVDNSKPLSAVFGGVHKASERLEKELALLHHQSNETRHQFVALGMGPDEMTASMVEYANMQRMMGNAEQLERKNLADETLKYQKNLKAISAITGQNAKEMQAERDARLRNAAFLAKIEELTAAGKHAEAAAMQEVVAAAAEYGPAQEALAMEIAVHGHAISKTSHMTAMTNKALADTTKANIDATKGFTGDAIAAQKLAREAYDVKADEIKAGRAQQRELAKMSNVVSGNEYVSAIEGTYVETKDTIDRTGKMADEFNNTLGAMQSQYEQELDARRTLTQQITDESARQQAIRNQIEVDTRATAESVVQVASTFTQTTEAINDSRRELIDGIQQAINDITKGAVKATPEQIYESIIKLIKDKDKSSQRDSDNKKGGFQGDGTFESQGGATFKGDVNVAGDIVVQGEQRKGSQGIGPSNNGVAFEGALGGIATGPKTGYRALLHGTEAVVPLPDGKSIPVNFDAEQLSMAMKEGMSGMMSASGGVNNEALEALMRQSVSLNSEILKTLKQSNLTSNKLVRVMS